VQKLSRILATGFAVVIGLLIILLLGVNLYVQSEGTHARIQQELSQRIGTTLLLKRISVTPWGGLKLSGITIPQPAPPSTPDFLTAKTFRLRVQLWSLFAQRLVIKEVSLVNPNVTWAQNANGEWRLPMLPEDSASTPHGGENTAIAQPSLAPAAVPTASSPPAMAETSATIPSIIPNDQPGEPETEEQVATEGAFTPEVRRVNVTGANFHFLDRRGEVVATFEGMEFHSSFRTATALRGNASIAKTSLRNRFFLEKLQSTLHYDPNALDFSQISATTAGGELNGRFRLQPQEPESPFTATVTFHDVQADKVVTEAGGPAGVIQGKLEGHLQAAGKTADPDALQGSGEIFLRDGEVKQYSLLMALGQLLQIDELTRLHLDQAEVKYHIEPGVVVVDDLLLKSANIRLSAKGTIAFTGKMRLQSQLAVNEKIRTQLFRAIRDNFKPTDQPGYAAVDFQVSGTVDKPKTNLMDKVVGRDIKDLGGVITSLFGGGNKPAKQPKRNPPADAATEPTPNPSEGAVTTASPSVSPEASVTDPAATPAP
jgi:hypothetical protein